MKFRAGLVTGFVAGFYLGTMAGRERYHQMNRMIRRAKRSDVIDAVTGRAKAVAGMSGARLAPAGRQV
jgi:hypothetical protein